MTFFGLPFGLAEALLNISSVTSLTSILITDLKDLIYPSQIGCLVSIISLKEAFGTRGRISHGVMFLANED
ncbi:putative L,D-transpeptidase YbiS [Frankliniella fusca]|uniref:L,D-transpeptidase YbiS n=1 Tax=Frankliniella fusca TaxID=407009 RepID=A0AAE1LAL4_9NEOP|nr:putative L,D-transpeptidase YbiS [Frankliniella fusca]